MVIEARSSFRSDGLPFFPHRITLETHKKLVLGNPNDTDKPDSILLTTWTYFHFGYAVTIRLVPSRTTIWIAVCPLVPT